MPTVERGGGSLLPPLSWFGGTCQDRLDNAWLQMSRYFGTNPAGLVRKLEMMRHFTFKHDNGLKRTFESARKMV